MPNQSHYNLPLLKMKTSKPRRTDMRVSLTLATSVFDDFRDQYGYDRYVKNQTEQIALLIDEGFWEFTSREDSIRMRKWYMGAIGYMVSE
jgi:hypothetical protein